MRIRNRVLALAIAAALPALASTAARADVTIGVLMPLTGPISAFGTAQQSALKMFEDQLGAIEGKGRIKLIAYDTRGNINEAINLTRKLISSDNVVAIVGPLLSGEAEAVFPIAVQAKTPIITPTAAKPGIAAANRPYAFRNALTTDKLNGPLIDSWLKNAGRPIKNVVILMDGKDAVSRSDGAQVYPPLLKARGLNILDSITFQTGDVDYSAQVTRAKSLNPDGVVVAALYNEGANAVREVRRQGMQQPILGNLGMINPRFIELGGPATEGVMLANDFYEDSADPSAVKWVAEFRKRFNTAPSNAAALMFDTMAVVRSCIMTQGITGNAGDLAADRDRMQKCWAGLKDFKAPVTGATTINADGEAVRQPVILQVKGGKFTALR